MAGETGIANSTITALLQGGRAMTRRHIETFARYFRIPPALFLGAGETVVMARAGRSGCRPTRAILAPTALAAVERGS
jgi:hypothetical protein